MDLRAETYPEDRVNKEQIHVTSTKIIAYQAGQYCVTVLSLSL